MTSADLIYKVLLIGESGVGKTSLIRSLTGCKFSHNMLTTVGIDFVKVPFNVDGASVILQIWDTAGQERFRSLTKFQYRGAKGLLLVYDTSNRETFDTLNYWMNSIEEEFDRETEEPIPVIMVGNKKDLSDEREVSEEEGRRLSEKNFLAGFYETSAFDGSNVQECFQRLANVIVDVYNPEKMNMYRISSEIDTLKRGGPFVESPDNMKNCNGHANKEDKNKIKRKDKKEKHRKHRKSSQLSKNSRSSTIKLPNKISKPKHNFCQCG